MALGEAICFRRIWVVNRSMVWLPCRISETKRGLIRVPLLAMAL